MDEKDLENLPTDVEDEEIIEDDDDDDIEFDDAAFDLITQQLQEHVDIEKPDLSQSEETPAEEESSDADIQPPEDNNSGSSSSVLECFPQEMCKKYVIHIDPENVDIVDSMSIYERRALINSIIHEKYSSDNKKQVVSKRTIYVKKLIIACLTVIISFPVLFFAVNKALEISIANYTQSEKNFEKLYREKGKVVNYQNFRSHK